MMLFACILFNLQFSFFNTAQASAQGTKTVAVKVSNKTQTINNKEYYIHIVEPGQTLFSIARAYGLKYYDAVIKTDIHLMQVGDTVWLPKNEYSVAAVSANATAAVSPASTTHYIKIEPGQHCARVWGDGGTDCRGQSGTAHRTA